MLEIRRSVSVSKFVSSSAGSESANDPGVHSTSDVSSMCRVVSSSSCWVGGRVSKPAMTPSREKGIRSGVDGTKMPKIESGAC